MLSFFPGIGEYRGITAVVAFFPQAYAEIHL